MPKQITLLEAAELHGIQINHELMDSGEIRFRLIASDGSGYARIHAPNVGYWQNSHVHSTMSEIIVVHKGWVVFVEIDPDRGSCSFQRFGAGAIFKSRPNIPHNLFVSANCILMCLKHGDMTANDWIASPALDNLTKHMTEDQVLAITSVSTTAHNDE